MPETASISLELKNMQEVLAVLREMRDIKRELEGGGSGGGSVPSSSSPQGALPSGGTPALPAPSSKNVTSLSSAAAGQLSLPTTSGTTEAQPVQSPGSTLPVPMNAPHGAQEPNVAKPSAPPSTPPVEPHTPKAPPVVPSGASSLKQLTEALGGFEAYQRLTALGNTATGELGMAVAQGRPFRPASLAPEAGALGITALGAAIGFGIGGPGGMLAGAAIVSPLSGMYESFAKPIAERDELFQEFSERSRSMGFAEPSSMAKPMLQAGMSLWSKGYRVSPEELARAGGKDSTGVWYNAIYKGVFGGSDFAGNDPLTEKLDPSDDSFSGRVAKRLYGTKSRGEVNDNAEIAGDFEQRVQTMRYSPAAMRSNRGIARPGWKGDISAMEANLWDDPFGVIASASEIQDYTKKGYHQSRDLIRRAELLAPQKEILAGEMELSTAGVAYRSTTLSIASRHGAKETQAAAEGLSSQMMELAEQQKKAAELYRSSNPLHYDQEKYKAMLMQSDTTRLQAHDAAVLPGLYARRDERQAASEFIQGRAERGFERSLYSGTSASNMPWGERSSALVDEIKLLRESMEDARKHGELSPVMKMQYEGQIAKAQLALDVELPRERAQMVWEEKNLVQDRDVARLRADRTPALLRASMGEHAAGTYDIEIEGTRKKLDLLQQELKVRTDLTAQERLSKEIQVESLKTQEATLQVAKDVAVISAKASTAYARTADERASTQVELIRSSGGDKGLTGRMNLLSAAGKDLATAEKKISDLKAKGFADDSEEVIAARGERDQAMVQKEQVRSDLINTPFSSASRVKEMQLQTEGALMQMGYGSFGDVRQNLKAQIKNTESDLSSLDQMKRDISKKFGWTDEDEVSYQERRRGLVMNAAQLAQQYNEGWDQRLISEAYNTPQNGRLAMSQFTHYESALAGIVHRSFGGTETQTRGYREETPRILSMYGSGNPANFSNHLFDDRKMYPNRAATIDRESGKGVDPATLKAAAARVHETSGSGSTSPTVRVELPSIVLKIEKVVIDSKGNVLSQTPTIRESAAPIHHFGTAQTTNENPHAKHSPAG